MYIVIYDIVLEIIKQSVIIEEKTYLKPTNNNILLVTGFTNNKPVSYKGCPSKNASRVNQQTFLHF